MGFDFLYIVAIFYDVNSLSGSLKYAECPFVQPLKGAGTGTYNFWCHLALGERALSTPDVSMAIWMKHMHMPRCPSRYEYLTFSGPPHLLPK